MGAGKNLADRHFEEKPPNPKGKGGINIKYILNQIN